MEPLLDVKSSFSIVSREESNQKNGYVFVVTNKNQSFAFAGKVNDTKKFKNRNQNFV